MLLLDVGEESGVGKVPLATGAPEFPLGLLFDLDSLDGIWRAVLFTHKFIYHQFKPKSLQTTTQRFILDKLTQKLIC